MYTCIYQTITTFAIIDNSSSLIQTILSVPDSHQIGCLLFINSSRTFDYSNHRRSGIYSRIYYMNITLPRRIPYLIYIAIVCVCVLYVNYFFKFINFLFLTSSNFTVINYRHFLHKLFCHINKLLQVYSNFI